MKNKGLQLLVLDYCVLDSVMNMATHYVNDIV